MRSGARGSEEGGRRRGGSGWEGLVAPPESLEAESLSRGFLKTECPSKQAELEEQGLS